MKIELREVPACPATADELDAGTWFVDGYGDLGLRTRSGVVFLMEDDAFHVNDVTRYPVAHIADVIIKEV